MLNFVHPDVYIIPPAYIFFGDIQVKNITKTYIQGYTYKHTHERGRKRQKQPTNIICIYKEAKKRSNKELSQAYSEVYITN